ncbi:MAG: SDR family NAD(P)-dependent oxidoreductase [Rhodospirillales bacterium]|jgi:short-subunit dehydrogenase|nr:SDR family NAD(P)-dependent oxidoreductase [Rhodospirillales bacterium]
MTARVAWCTGAGKGIGRSLALELARRGWVVAASSRTVADLDRLAEDTKGPSSGRVFPYPLDVVDAAANERTAAAIRADLGPIDLAVFNAGTHIPVSARTFSVEPFRTLMEVNVLGVANGIAAVLPQMRERARGQIAVVASVAGYCGLPSAAAYGATKAALITMCEALKPELDTLGIAISVVNPGFVRTPLTDKNPFPMPFLIDADVAARRIADGLASRRFEVAFPWQMVTLLKLLRALPYPLFFAITRRLMRD